MLYATKSHFNVLHNLPSSRTETIPVRIYFQLAMTIANSESPSPDQNAVHSVASDRELPRSLGTKQADQVSHSAIGRTAKRGTTVASRLASKCVELAKTFLNDRPKFRGAWRVKACYEAARLLLRQGGTDLAAALGFFTVMSLLPLVALTIMALIAVGSDEGALRILAEALDYLFPASHELIDDAVGNLLGGSFTIGLIALGGLIIGANGLFAAAYRATNRVFGIDSSTLFQVTVKNVSLVTILVVAFLTSIALTSVIQVLVRFSQDISDPTGGLSIAAAIIFGSLSAILPAIFTAVVFAFVYFRLPNTRVEWRDAAFGAIVAIVLFEIGKHVFFWFNNQASYRSHIYGPITSVVVLMLWAYIASLIYLYGAALTKVAGELRPK